MDVSATVEASPATSVGHLWLADFRCFSELDLAFGPGLTVLYGANGQGKTSLLEAVSGVARARSFRGVAYGALVRAGFERAIIRAEVVTGARQQLFEAEVRAAGRNRILCNKQPVSRARDLTGLLRVTAFSPDDLALVKEGPSQRRDYLDELLAMLAARYDAARTDYERVLRQRNALLRVGMRDEHAAATLDVFDEQLVQAASELVRGRLRLAARLAPAIDLAYRTLAEADAPVTASYEAEWAGGPLSERDAEGMEERLRAALAARRRNEIDRGLTLVGPHRDEWALAINGLDTRTQASQGEQRTLALAMRLAGHAVVTELTSTAPVLLLDDVFSELDAARARSLVHNLPHGQTLVTTASVLPDEIVADRRLRVHDGRVEEDT